MATRKLVELQKEVITPFQKTNYINPLYQKQLSKLNNSGKRLDMSKVLELYKDFINTFIKELFLLPNNKLSRKQRELRKIILLSFETYTLLYKYNKYKINFLENEKGNRGKRLKFTKKQEFSIFKDFIKENSIIFSNDDVLNLIFKETDTLNLDQIFDKFVDFLYNHIYLKNSKKFRSRLINLVNFDYKTQSFKVIESVRLTIKILEKDTLTDVDKEFIFYKTFEILYKHLLQTIDSNDNSNLETLDIDKLEELVLKETNYINTIDRETDLYISKVLLFFIHNSKVIYKNLSETKYKWKLYQDYIFENLFNFLYKLAIHSNLSLSLEDRFNQVVLSFVKGLREIDIIEIFKTYKRINQVKSPLTILFDRIQSKIEAYNKEIVYSVNSHLKIDKDSLDLIQKIFRKLNKIEFEIYYLFESGLFKKIGTLHKIYLDYIQDKLKRFENNKVKYKYQIDFFSDINNSLLVEYFVKSESLKSNKIQDKDKYNLSNIFKDQKLKEEFLRFLFERDILSKNQYTNEIGINILSVIELIVKYDKEIEKDLIKVFGESVNESNKDTLVNKVKDLIFYYYENYSTTNKEVLNVYSGYSVNSTKRIITIDNIVNYNYLDGSKTIDDYLDDNKLHYSENVSEANYSKNIEDKEKELEFKQIYKELINLGVKEVGLIPTLTFHILYQLSLEDKNFDIFEFLSKGNSELEEKIVLKLTDKEYVNNFLKEFGLIEIDKDISEIQNNSTFKDFECIKKLYVSNQTQSKRLRRIRKSKKSLTHSFIRSKRLLSNYYMCIRSEFSFNIVNINKINVVIGGSDKVLVILTNLYRIFVENNKVQEKLKELLIS